VILACGALPAAWRPVGASMPWSMALRTMCIGGSDSSSAMVLSGSVFSPHVTSSTCLATFRDRSRTWRAVRWKSWPIGTIRIAMAVRCTSPVMAGQLRQVAMQPWIAGGGLVMAHQRQGDHHLAHHVHR
jgi:hypothetical protein